MWISRKNWKQLKANLDELEREIEAAQKEIDEIKYSGNLLRTNNQNQMMTIQAYQNIAARKAAENKQVVREELFSRLAETYPRPLQQVEIRVTCPQCGTMSPQQVTIQLLDQ